jgi:hypothetical protein
VGTSLFLTIFLTILAATSAATWALMSTQRHIADYHESQAERRHSEALSLHHSLHTSEDDEIERNLIALVEQVRATLRLVQEAVQRDSFDWDTQFRVLDQIDERARNMTKPIPVELPVEVDSQEV